MMSGPCWNKGKLADECAKLAAVNYLHIENLISCKEVYSSLNDKYVQIYSGFIELAMALGHII